jgi:hypothetical protein
MKDLSHFSEKCNPKNSKFHGKFDIFSKKPLFSRVFLHFASPEAENAFRFGCDG